MSKNYNDPFHNVDYNAIIDGTRCYGVKSGLAVSEDTPQGMDIDVAAGTALINTIEYVESGITNLVISASHATLPRRDIVIYDASAGNPAVITGIAASEPIPPDITSGDILLAIINIPAAATVITNTDIEDGRISVIIPNHAALHMFNGSDPINYYNKDVDQNLHDNSTLRSTASTTYVKVKETIINFSGDTLKISFRLCGGAGTTAYGRIYRNGVAVGTEQLTGSTGWETKEEDIVGWSDGDLLQLYGHRSGGSYNAQFENLIIKGANIILDLPTSGFTDNS